MASPPYNIVSELLDRVQELSNAVAPQSQRNSGSRSGIQSQMTSNNQSSTTTLQQEVSRVFNRPSQAQGSSSSAPAPLRSSNNSQPIFSLRRNFRGRSGGSKPKKPKQPNGPFLRDMVLLTGPGDRLVPKQGARVWLSEHGHILTGFEFYKEWNGSQVEIAIKEAFDNKIPARTDFEILMSVHSSLVAPTLAPGQTGLNGIMIHRIFKTKPLYIRPADKIVDSTRLNVPWSLENTKQTKEDSDDSEEFVTPLPLSDQPSALFELTNDQIQTTNQNQPITNFTQVQPTNLNQNQPITNFTQVQLTNTNQIQPITNLTQVQPTYLSDQIPLTNLNQVQSTNLNQIQPSNLNQIQPTNISHVHPTINLVAINETNVLQDQSFDLSQSTDVPIHVHEGPDQSQFELLANNDNSQTVEHHNLVTDDDLLEHKQILIHRQLIRDEVIEIFQDPEILKYILNVIIIGNDGNPEKGMGRGVMLEVLTSFWKHLYDSVTLGTQEKVLSIRHDFQRSHWQAIARVLVYGYSREKYFPIRLSPAFIAAAIFGEESISKDFLLSSFQLYISYEEKETLVAALAGNLSMDDEDLLDLLSNYKCRRSITQDTLVQTINELAHQEIIQKPRYVIDCFSRILGLLRVYSPFESVKNLAEMYDCKKPTSRKIVKLLEASPTAEAEHACLDHLKRYIRSLEASALNQFLAFVTGSDVIV